MITIQFQAGASVDQRLDVLAEFVGGLADAVGQKAFAEALGARKAERDKAKAEAEKAAAAVPAKLKRGRRRA